MSWSRSIDMGMPVHRFGVSFFLLAALCIPNGATAAETGGCESFAWPVKTELQWMGAAARSVASGAKLEAPPHQALDVKLVPMKDVTYPVAPTAKRKDDAETAFGGLVSFDTMPSGGTYQVSLSGRGWIDAVQDGKVLSPVAHSGKSDCQGLRKSVRFELGDKPLLIELSGVPQGSIKMTIRRAD